MMQTRRFLVRKWPDGSVVFNNMSGDTHALDALTYAAFEATEGSDEPAAAVLDTCQSHYPSRSADELESMAQACCERLETCGLTTFQTQP